MKIIFKSPAQSWHESFILGNGRIGAAVYGGTKKEQIALNEDSYPGTQATNLQGIWMK